MAVSVGDGVGVSVGVSVGDGVDVEVGDGVTVGLGDGVAVGVWTVTSATCSALQGTLVSEGFAFASTRCTRTRIASTPSSENSSPACNSIAGAW
jgi:hypothetical protein